MDDLFKLGYSDLINFCILTDPRYTANWHHDAIANELMELEKRVTAKSDKQLFLLIEMPPRHGKSELTSIKFPAWFLGRNPDKEIITASYSGDLAVDFGSQTRDLVNSPEYKQVFKTRLKEDDKSKGRWKTQNKGAYTSVGVGGAITGRGANILLIDDPLKNREEAESLVIREKVWGWFQSTAFTRLEPNGAVVVVMTRWNVDDLSGRIQEAFKGNDNIEIRRVVFPAIAEEDEEFREKGEALWKDKYDLDSLETIKNVVGVRDWSALYQQDPIKSTGNVFKKEEFSYFNLSELKPEEYELAVHVDPAWSSRDDSDDIAIMVTARHKQTKEIYLIDCLAETLLPSQAYNYIISTLEQWKSYANISFLSVEKATISKGQDAFVKGLEEKMKAEGKFYTTLYMNPVGRGQKEDRIKNSLEPMFNRRAIHFRADNKNIHWQKLEEQLLKFPVNTHDDMADCLSQGVIMWDGRGDGALEDYEKQVRRQLSTPIVNNM